jgi:5-methylcytosine-specific restriction endonuclease McrA
MPTGHYQRSPRVEHIQISCEVCGTVRSYAPEKCGKRGQIRFCSRKCMGIAAVKPDRHRLVTCERCGKEVNRRVDHLNKNSHTYCSAKCRSEARQVPGARWKNPARIAAYMASYAKENHELFLARARIWRRAHRTSIRQTQINRRNARAEGNHSIAEWEALLQQYGFRCLACGRTEPTIKLEADHVVSLFDGGSNAITNIQPLCRSCNARKGIKTIDYRDTPILETS